MFPLSALLAHAELKTRAKQPPAEASREDGRGAIRVTRYGNLTLYPLVERAELVRPTDGFAPGESLPDEVIEAVWEEPRVVASISNVSTSGMGLILNDELPAGLQFDVNWEEGENPGPLRFEVVHTRPLSAGLFRTGARVVNGELPVEQVPTPFVRRFELASEAAEPLARPTMAIVSAERSAEPMAEGQTSNPSGPTSEEAAEGRFAPLSLVRDGVLQVSRVPTDQAPADRRRDPAGTFSASLAGGFEKTERLDGHTVCGWERSVEIRREGERMWIYVHSPGKKNGWGLFVDAAQFQSAVDRVQATAGSPFVATTLAA
jgi:hypothetical protein